MNALDPELKRLLRWSRRASAPSPAETPRSFSTRVVARWEPVQSTSPGMNLETWATVAAWVSAVVILAGVIFFAEQTRTPPMATDFTTAAQFVASLITP